MNYYKKTEIGWLFLALVNAVGIFVVFSKLFGLGNSELNTTHFYIIISLLISINLLFYKLIIELNKNVLKLSYGIGLIKIKFTIEKIESIEIIKTPWYYGLGIRVTPNGMLYNIQSLNALKIKFVSNGKKKTVMVGSPKPEELKEKLWAACS